MIWKWLSFPLAAAGYDTVVCQFGGYHSWVPAFWKKILRKKLIIVLGGYDCVSFPAIGYGAFANKWMSKAIRYAYVRADLLLPVHESLMYEENTYAPEHPTNQGIRAFLPNIKAKHQVIFNGYDPDKWHFNPTETPRKTIISVASGFEEKRRATLKGIDVLCDAALLLPEVDFILVGGQLDNLSPNVTCVPETSQEELNRMFTRSGYIAQLSLSEGFPNALSEAMLCGCVPIVSEVAAMPDIVGDFGFILKKRSVEDLVSLIQKLPVTPDRSDRVAIRNRIASLFPEANRKHQLIQAISESSSQNHP
ncbi:MAG: glycosyltransferase family 4 protein [Flavobacteriales bacterium]